MPSAKQEGTVLALHRRNGQDVKVPVRDISLESLTQAVREVSERLEGPATPAPTRTLAQRAKALAPDLHSSFLPKDAEVFLEEYRVSRTDGRVSVLRGDDTVVFRGRDLRAYARGESKTPAVGAGIRLLSADSRLWGRKLAAFIVASVGR